MGYLQEKQRRDIEQHNDVLLQALLDRPNALSTWDDLMTESIGFQLLNGNTFYGVFLLKVAQ